MNANEQIALWLIRHTEEVMPHVSSRRIIDELQIAIERISFIVAANNSVHTNEELPALYEVFEGQVSDELTKILQVLVDQGYVRIFIGPQGRATLTYCVSYYDKIPEIVFATAVDMSNGLRAEVLTMLRKKHPEPQKIVFQTMPSLIAGFRIYGDNDADYSLRSFMNDNIPGYVKTKLATRIRGNSDGS